ncbi:hypothetical protein [Rossellomorea vietnamensis]|nr:hypothetical protein [Rossellomorea vietnamensis]
MANEKMSKKLRQAVDYANSTNPSSRSRNQPNSSKTERFNSGR